MDTSKNAFNKKKFKIDVRELRGKVAAFCGKLWKNGLSLWEIKTVRYVSVVLGLVLVFVSGLLVGKYLLNANTEDSVRPTYEIDSSKKPQSVLLTITSASTRKITGTTPMTEDYEFLVDLNIRITGTRDITPVNIEALKGQKVLVLFEMTTDGRKVATRISLAK